VAVATPIRAPGGKEHVENRCVCLWARIFPYSQTVYISLAHEHACKCVSRPRLAFYHGSIVCVVVATSTYGSQGEREREQVGNRCVFVGSYIPIFTDGLYIISTRAHTQVCKSASSSFLPRERRLRGCCNSDSGSWGGEHVENRCVCLWTHIFPYSQTVYISLAHEQTRRCVGRPRQASCRGSIVFVAVVT